MLSLISWPEYPQTDFISRREEAWRGGQMADAGEGLARVWLPVIPCHMGGGVAGLQSLEFTRASQ